jgi:hypothetical protein
VKYLVKQDERYNKLLTYIERIWELNRNARTRWAVTGRGIFDMEANGFSDNELQRLADENIGR